MNNLASLATSVTTTDLAVEEWAARPLAPKEDEATAVVRAAAADAGLDDDATRRVAGAARTAVYFHNAARKSAAHHVRWRRDVDPVAVRLTAEAVQSATVMAAHFEAVRAELGL
jgi:hypothetical protein